MDIWWYNSVIYFLLFMPFLVIVALYYFLKFKDWRVQYPIIILVGWLTLLVFTTLINTFSVKFAPDVELMQKALQGDGASNAFVLLFGWLPSLIFLEAINKLFKFLNIF